VDELRSPHHDNQLEIRYLGCVVDRCTVRLWGGQGVKLHHSTAVGSRATRGDFAERCRDSHQRDPGGRWQAEFFCHGSLLGRNDQGADHGADLVRQRYDGVCRCSHRRGYRPRSGCRCCQRDGGWLQRPGHRHSRGIWARCGSGHALFKRGRWHSSHAWCQDRWQLACMGLEPARSVGRWHPD
jgi:hypothetical protein